MQEEVTQKTVTFCIRTTKITADLLKKVLVAYLRHQKQKSVEKKAQKNQPKQGKVTVKELAKQNAGMVNIEITDKNIKSFERYARKYGINYALKKDKSKEPPVYLVPAGVAGKGLHVTRTFLEHTQVFVAVFQEHVLVVKVVAGKQKPHGGRERQQAVRTVGGKTLVTGVRTHVPRQVFRVRERVQAHPFVTHAQNLGPQLDVLKRSRLREREGKVPLQQARTIRRTRDLVPSEADKGQETRIVQNTLELFRRLQEFCRRFPVYLFGNDVAPAEGREV